MSLQARVGEWHEARFPGAEMQHVALKASEEVGELASAVLAVVGKDSATGSGDIAAEAADVAICLMAILHRWVPGADLFAEVERKLATLNDPSSGHRAALRAGGG